MEKSCVVETPANVRVKLTGRRRELLGADKLIDSADVKLLVGPAAYTMKRQAAAGAIGLIDIESSVGEPGADEMQTPTVEIAGADEFDRIVAPLTLAFVSDPLVRWLLPDPLVYLACFPAIVQIHAVRVTLHGGAFLTEDSRAAALWYPPGTSVDSPSLGKVFQRALPQSRLEEVTSLFTRMAEYKPVEPHWYLRQIGVDPAARHRGYGSALLRASLEVVDRERLAAYLEATSSDNRLLYERFGFVAFAEIRVGDAPPLWPMLRNPR